MKKREQGTFIVEFAIIAAALFLVLFAVMELSRIIWIWNTADEATRRGARVAAVCPIGNFPGPLNVRSATVFADPSGSVDPAPSPILRGLTTDNVTVEYLDASGGDQGGAPVFNNTRYVRVKLNGYTVTPLIPFINTSITLPDFETTIPSESLGLIPPAYPPECGCFGGAPGPC